MFLVRIWREPFDPRAAPKIAQQLLIQVETVKDGKQHYFGSFEQMLAFFQAWFERPSNR
ncbi:MAG: hypothetical protein HZB51_11560 [Chloroflexi bacterium]|nr:hypothetical protein [Chloroflexota bacterium]